MSLRSGARPRDGRCGGGGGAHIDEDARGGPGPGEGRGGGLKVAGAGSRRAAERGGGRAGEAFSALPRQPQQPLQILEQALGVEAGPVAQHQIALGIDQVDRAGRQRPAFGRGDAQAAIAAAKGRVVLPQRRRFDQHPLHSVHRLALGQTHPAQGIHQGAARFIARSGAMVEQGPAALEQGRVEALARGAHQRRRSERLHRVQQLAVLQASLRMPRRLVVDCPGQGQRREEHRGQCGGDEGLRAGVHGCFLRPHPRRR